MENLQNLPAVGEDDALHEYLQKGITQIHGSPDAQLPMNIVSKSRHRALIC